MTDEMKQATTQACERVTGAATELLNATEKASASLRAAALVELERTARRLEKLAAKMPAAEQP